MANVTRIKNNQITDSTITYQKIKPGTLIGSLFNPDLTLNSNVSIIGNLTVAGYSSTVSSTNTYVNDPLVVFNNGYTGSLTGYDIGILINRNLGNLPGYGSVNTAWVWSEADGAFVALATTDTAAGTITLTNSGYANVIVGNLTALNLHMSGDVYATAFHGNIYSTNGIITNFSSSNVLITGGNISGLTGLTATTGVITNFSSSNVLITGGNISGLTGLDVETAVITNFSTGNALITGGNISGLTGLTATTGVITNFSTGNVLITGGNISGLTGLDVTTLHATNFSTGNALITGGYADNFPIGANTPATGNFTTISANGIVQITNSTNNNGTQYTSGALQIAGGAGIGGNLYVQGTIFASNLIATTQNQITVTDPLLYLMASNPSTYNYEIGFYSHFIDPDYQHTGLARDHNDYIWKLFSNVSEPSGATVNFSTAIWDKLKLGELIVANTTPSVSSTTGAITVAGGVGIGGNLYVAGNLIIPGISAGAINNTIIGNTGPSAGTFTYLTVSTGFATSNAQITGGNISGIVNLDVTTLYATNFSTGNAVISGGSVNGTPIGASSPSTGAFTTLSSSGLTYFSNDTEAITSNIGSVVLAGGLAVNKQIMVGGNLVATSTTGSTTYTTGSFVTKGGAGIAGDVYVNKGIVVNENNGSYDFVVKGANSNTLLWSRSNSTYDQVLIGNTTASGALVQGAKLQIASTDSILLPVGSTAQRPSGAGYTDVAGMLRFSSTTGAIEWYNGSSWDSGAIPFTVITDQQFSGDGSTLTFTLTSTATTNGIIVSINGVVQIPTLAYAVVSGTTLTFTEAPADGDIIDVRTITSTQTVTHLASVNGYNQIQLPSTGIDLYTGTSSAINTTSWNSTGAQVSKLPVTVIASSGVATTIDSFNKTVYRSAKYIVQASISGSYHAQEALVVHDGSTATLVLGTAAVTSGSLGTITATVSGNDVLLQFNAVNNATDVRIKKDYIIL